MSDEKKPFNETGFGKFLKKVGGIVPNVIEAAAQAATGNIGGAIDTIAGGLREKAANDAEAAALLAELETQRAQWQLESERIAAADRASARGREVDMAKSGFRDWIPAILAAVGVTCFGFALWVIAFRTIPEANRELFIHAMGIIEGSMVTLIFNYYFGSSAGSRAKTELLKQQ